MGLRSPSVPSAFPLTLPLGSPDSVQWLAVSTCTWLSQVLVEPLRGQPYQTRVGKHILPSAIVSGMGPKVGLSLDGLSFSLCSTLCPCISRANASFEDLRSWEPRTCRLGMPRQPEQRAHLAVWCVPWVALCPPAAVLSLATSILNGILETASMQHIQKHGFPSSHSSIHLFPTLVSSCFVTHLNLNMIICMTMGLELFFGNWQALLWILN